MGSVVIIELLWPGTWITGSLDQDAAFRASTILHLMESRLWDAALSLDLFDSAQVPAFSTADAEARKGEWEQANAERRAIQDELRRRVPAATESAIFDQARRLQMRLRWEAGQLPTTLQRRLPFVHARGFVNALDSVGKAARQAKTNGWEVDKLRVLLEAWELIVPGLRGVRDSTAHEDERALGRQYGKPISLQPIDNGMVSAPGGALIMDSLNNNRYGCTLASGHYGEVEVSAETLRATVGLVQGALDAFTWEGPERWSPSD